MTGEEGKTLRLVYIGSLRRRVPGIGVVERDVPIEVPIERAEWLLQRRNWKRFDGASKKKAEDKPRAGEGGKSAKKEA